MPAPRSVLIDIHERGLNPQVAHKSTDSSGRIRGSAAEPQLSEVPEPKKKTVKTEKKVESKDETSKDENVTGASGEATGDEATNEGAGSVEPKSEEAGASATVTSRQRKRTAPSNA